MAVGVFDEVGDDIGKVVTKAAESGTAMEGIERITQDKSDGGWRREANGDKLLTKHIVRKIVIRRMIVADDPIAILQMPTDTPVGRRSSGLLDIAITRLTYPFCLVGQHP